jgi:disulfide bond formation protein DsbB
METHPLYTAALNHYLSLATILGGAVGIALTLGVIYLFTKKKTCKSVQFASEYVLPLGFLISFLGMVMSLFYSEVVNYIPCDLCWYQRIFMYSQVFLFAYAWYRKDRAILPYTLLLSLFGLAIGIYHHMLQIGFDLMKPCSSAPFAVDCAKPSFIEYGFVTFPLMSVVLFGFLSLLMIVAMKFRK